jgi:hypothetical protein
MFLVTNKSQPGDKGERCRAFEGNYGSRIPIGGSYGDLDVATKGDFKFLVAVEIAETMVTHSHEIKPYNPQQNESEGISCAGQLHFTRHVNHRLFDQVKQQVRRIGKVI